VSRASSADRVVCPEDLERLAQQQGKFRLGGLAFEVGLAKVNG